MSTFSTDVTPQKPIILFDLDTTLLDTKGLMNSYLKPTLQQELGVEIEEFETVAQGYFDRLPKSTLFDPQEFATYLADAFETKRERLLQVFWQKEAYRKSVFEEVVPVLEQLQKKYRMGIFSEGNSDFQRQKLELSGLVDFFEEELVFISDDKVSENFVVTLPETTIVDDRLQVIEKLQIYPKLRLIWLNRSLGPEVSEIYIETVMSLNELVKILD